jgi:hypothetical protein
MGKTVASFVAWLMLLLLIAPALAQPRPPSSKDSQPDQSQPRISKAVAPELANSRKLTNALAAGADSTGTVAVSAMVQASVDVGKGMFFPCGTYLFDMPVTVTRSNIGLVGESASCVNFVRLSDFGPMFAFANASGPITNERMSGMTIVDQAAVNGTSGYATCAKSPFHITWDGVQYSIIDDVRFAMGCGGLSIKAAYNVWLSHTQYFFAPIRGGIGQNGLGTALHVGSSSNRKLSAAQSANVWVQDADIECGSGTSQTKCAYGYVLDGVDGVFARSVHVEYAQRADFRFGNNAEQPMLNISCVECFADITPGIGLLLDGGSNISNLFFSGSVDAAGLNITNPGISLSGAGGLSNSVLDVHVRGWGAQGILLNADNTSNVIIRPRDLTMNNGGSGASVADIDVEQGTNITISGGTLDGYGTTENRVPYGIQFGAGVKGANVIGVSSRRHSTLAANVLNGASNINFVGGDFTGNAANGIQVLGPPGSVMINGTLGVPWASYIPVIACRSGLPGTLGAVSASYQVRGKTLSLQISIPITSIGSCAGAITTTLPPGWSVWGQV